MIDAFSRLLNGQGLFARAARGSVWSMGGFAVSQAIRLASNLILTRLLFPEAFGLMSLVTVITVGVVMLSEVGIGLSVIQSKRGDDQNFLDTAWTAQVIRGFLLCVVMGLLAWPASWLYGEELLAPFLLVSAVGVMVNGFNPIRLETASRHMLIGRLTTLDIATQGMSVAIIILLAWLTGSVWSLIIGNLCGSIIRLVLANVLLPGTPSRFRWEPEAARELIHFGKWIFVSTAFGFFLAQGDRVVLGTYVSLELLGIYNVAQFLATAPMLLASTALQRVIIPLYRESIADPSGTIANRLTKLRRYFTLTFLLLQGFVALVSVMVVGFLYDDRYAAAGPIAVLLALVQMPLIIGMTYDRSALASGDSRNFFFNVAGRTILQMACFIVGAELGGLPLAIVGQLVSSIIGHAGYVWLARKTGVWDAWHDLVYSGLAIVLASIALWFNWGQVAGLIASN